MLWLLGRREAAGLLRSRGCYRPLYLSIQQLNYLRAIRPAQKALSLRLVAQP